MRPKSYFTLHEIVLLTLLAALVFVLRVYLRIPTHIPGKSGFFWVIPIIIGIGIAGKPGSGTYMGVISGTLAVLFGIGDNGALEFINYLAMGLALDAFCLLFMSRLDNVLAGVVIGAGANLSKMIVNYSLDYIMGVPLELIVLKMNIAPVTHFVAGGLGGAIAALILGRLYRSGVVRKHE